MKEDDPDLYDKYYSEGAFACFPHAIIERIHFKFHDPEALQAKIGTLSLEAQTKLEKETKKKEAKAEAKADAALKKKLASQVRPPGFLTRVLLFKISKSTGNDQEDRAYEAQARHRHSRSRGIWHRSQKGGQAARWAVCYRGVGDEERTGS